MLLAGSNQARPRCEAPCVAECAHPSAPATTAVSVQGCRGKSACREGNDMSSSLYKSGTPCVSAARSETDIAFSAPSRLTYLPQRLFLRCFPCSSSFLSRNIFVTRLGERGHVVVADLIAQSIALVKPALRILSDGNDITPRCVASAVWGWVYVL